jgi:hypothetical protein
MSEFSFESPLSESRPEIVSDGSMGISPPAPALSMPFDADSREAEALRGAISFLFALITTYDELIASGETAGNSACGDSGPH